MSKSRTVYILYVGPWDVRVPRWVWVITPLPGHTLGGN
jgi:hypothetical protein